MSRLWHSVTAEKKIKSSLIWGLQCAGQVDLFTAFCWLPDCGPHVRLVADRTGRTGQLPAIELVELLLGTLSPKIRDIPRMIV